MVQLTSIELGASGNFVRFDDAELDNLGSKTWIILCRPTGTPENNFGYLLGKTPTGSINGERLFLDTVTGAGPRWNYSFHSTGLAGSPTRNTVDNTAVIGRWHLLAVTHDGTLDSTAIHIYSEVADAGGVLTGTLAEASYAGNADGVTAFYDDSANPLFLGNRFGLSRAFVGDWYAFQWGHVKTLSQINAIAAAIVAETGGPLDDTTDMQIGWANQVDLSPNGLTEASRSTFAAGTLPAYTELGGAAPITGTLAATLGGLTAAFTGTVEANAITGTLAATLGGVTAAFTGTADQADGAITGTMAATLGGITAAAAGKTAFFYDDFDTSCIRIAGSTITGVGDAAVFSVDSRPILSVAAPASARWLQSVFEIRGGISGLTPIIEFQDYATWHPKINSVDWQSTRRIYKRIWNGSAWGAWENFGGAPTVGASTVRYTGAFGSGTRMQFATTIPYSLADDEAFLTALAASYPNAIKNALSNTSDFRSLTYGSQTTDLSETTGASFSLSAVIDDDDKPSPSGARGVFDINGGTHAGEYQGKRVWRSIVTRLMEDETKANYLRTHLAFHLRPSLEPIGGDHGHWRGDWDIAPGETTQTVDLNRAAQASGSGLDVIENFQDINAQDHAGRAVVHGQVDCHGDYGSAGGNMAGFFNVDEVASIGALRTGMEVYLGGGTVTDFGPFTVDSVEKAYREVWGSPLSATLEISEASPRSDADYDAVADAFVQTLYDMLQAGGWHFNVGTAAATLGGITASFTGTAAGTMSITGTFAAILGALTAAFTGTAATPITGTMAATLGGVTASFTGTASEYPPLAGGGGGGGMLASVGTLMNR